MHKLVLAASLVAAIILVGCGVGQAAPMPSGSPAPATPSATPEVSPSPVPSPTVVPATPAPATPKPTVEPVPSPTALTADEKYLLAGIQRGAIDCEPVRSSLPPRATAGIECASDSPVVARVGFYLFDNESDLLAAYFARMKAEGVATESGETCRQGESEHAYIPGEGPEVIANRVGCFINEAGIANYRATFPARVYIGILGRSADMGALEDWAWNGSQDTPGSPTLWYEPGLSRS